MSAGIDREQLRLLVREVLRDAIGAQARAAAPAAPPPAPPSTPAAQLNTPPPTGPLAADERMRTDSVRIASDADLDGFVRQLLRLFENPKTRADLRAGRLRFRLAGAGRAPAGPATRRIERGAVTERHIAELGDSGATLVLGPRAVLTPLARERARALGITISKERS